MAGEHREVRLALCGVGSKCSTSSRVYVSESIFIQLNSDTKI